MNKIDKLKNKNERESMLKKNEIVLEQALINRVCSNRQSQTKEIDLNVLNRLKKARIERNIINANNFTAISQAQLIDIVIRTHSVTNLNDIANYCLLHKDCESVFKEKCNKIDILKRVKRHNNKDYEIRIIKRNSFKL